MALKKSDKPKGKPKRLPGKAKEVNRIKLMEYLSNPSNDFVTREEMSLVVLGYKNITSIYDHFRPHELDEIEREAMEARRKRYAPRLSKVDLALLAKATEGDPVAAKLVYQRFEGWAPETKSKNEHSGPGGAPLLLRWADVPPPMTLEEWERAAAERNVPRGTTDGSDD